jgi:predicted lipoprotein with Yx(FWY)xxD motif
MTSSRVGPREVVIAAAGGALALLLAACGSSSGGGGASGGGSPSASGSGPAASGAFLSTSATPVGMVLVDHHGKALYVFAADQPGKSNCTGSCLTYWPPVSAPKPLPTDPSGVTAKLGVITGTDGSRQLTVNGWPVYTYVGDSTPAAVTGQGLNSSGGLWWVVSPSGSQITAAPTNSSSSSPSSSGGYGY